MGNLIAKPQVSFSEAIRLGVSRLTDFRGRSRRSEFWWFILAFYVAMFFVEFFLTLFLPAMVETIISIALMFLAFGVTVRRLHDVGQSGWWVVASWIVSAIGQVYSNNLMASGVLESGNTKEMLEAMITPIFWIPVLIGSILSIVIFIFCLLDSKVKSNKYGASPKYVVQEETAEADTQEA